MPEYRFNVVAQTFEPCDQHTNRGHSLARRRLDPSINQRHESLILVGDECWVVLKRELRHPIPPLDLADLSRIRPPR